MKKIVFIIFLLFPITLFAQTNSQLPDWINNPPSSRSKFYAVGKGSSRDAQIAERKADLEAKVKLAELVEPAVVTFTTRIDSIVRGNQLLIERVSVIRRSVNAQLLNVQIVKRHVQNDDGLHTVYLLVTMPRKELTQTLVNLVTNDKDLNLALSSNKEYQKLIKEFEP